jgi:hypothetical protein
MNFNMKALVCAVFAVALLGGAVTEGSVGARTSYITFSGAVRLPGVTLPAGTYIFERVDSLNRIDLVRVLARDRSKTYMMGFTNLVERPAKMSSKATITLGEAAAGMAPAVTAWYPAGENTGHQFNY